MESLEEEVDRVAAETAFSGVVRVDRGDDVELAKGYGLAHRGTAGPHTFDTQFCVPSSVKTRFPMIRSAGMSKPA